MLLTQSCEAVKTITPASLYSLPEASTVLIFLNRPPFCQVRCFFGSTGVNQQRHIGNASSLEAVHDPLVPPGAVAKIISRHH